MNGTCECGMKAIVAMAPNRGIGLGGRIPWHLPGDLRFFKQLTTGHIVLMGRKTFESIGRPLPTRENWILSRHGEFQGVRIFRSPDEVPRDSRDERSIFVIGGAAVYATFAPFCSELFLTRVHLETEADTFFPPMEKRFAKCETLLETPEFSIQRFFEPVENHAR